MHILSFLKRNVIFVWRVSLRCSLPLPHARLHGRPVCCHTSDSCLHPGSLLSRIMLSCKRLPLWSCLTPCFIVPLSLWWVACCRPDIVPSRIMVCLFVLDLRSGVICICICICMIMCMYRYRYRYMYMHMLVTAPSLTSPPSATCISGPSSTFSSRPAGRQTCVYDSSVHYVSM